MNVPSPAARLLTGCSRPWPTRRSAEEIPWQQPHLYWADERCVPPDHPDSNFHAVDELLLRHVPIPRENIHRMLGELEPAQAAARYEDTLRARFALRIRRASILLPVTAVTPAASLETFALFFMPAPRRNRVSIRARSIFETAVVNCHQGGRIMKPNRKLALAALAGIFAGIAGAEAIHAQPTRTPPGYVIAEVEVTDPAAMQKYGEKVPETLAPFNHQYLVRGSQIQPLEGEPPKGGIVIIAFDSAAQARDWYDSPAYKAIRPIRQSAAKSRIFIVEGVAPR